MKEMTGAECEAAAAKWPLPQPTEREDYQLAEQFVLTEGKGALARYVLGQRTDAIRKRWRAWRQIKLESRRYDNWLKASGAFFDRHRSTYIVQNPNPPAG